MAQNRWGSIEYIVPQEERRVTDTVKPVVEALLKDRVRFIRILESLAGSRMVDAEDAQLLRSMENMLKGSPARAVVGSLVELGRRKGRLLALIVAYAVYHVKEN